MRRAGAALVAAGAALALAACGGASSSRATTPAAATTASPAATSPRRTSTTPAAIPVAPVPAAATAAVPLPTPLPAGGTVVVVPGQPALGAHAQAVAPPASDPTAVRLYAALDAAYAARARFLREGGGCLGVRTIDCFYRLNGLGSRVAAAGGAVGQIARTASNGSACGAATRAFANGEQLLRATVATWIQASNPEENDPPSAVREEAAHAAAAYNVALLGFRAACGERSPG